MISKLDGLLDRLEAAQAVGHVEGLKDEREGHVPAAHTLHWGLQVQEAVLLRNVCKQKKWIFRSAARFFLTRSKFEDQKTKNEKWDKAKNKNRLKKFARVEICLRNLYFPEWANHIYGNKLHIKSKLFSLLEELYFLVSAFTGIPINLKN